ncbi:MAG: DUF1217 domain-containing protein [Rhodomicrobium sp.]
MSVSTLSTYLQISNNQTKWENFTASEPVVKQQTAYYQANIGNVKTPSDLVNNYRLFSYVMTAYGLGDMTSYGKGLIQKVLEQGTGNQKDLAYTLNNPQILALAQTFNFTADGASATASTAVQSGVVKNYIEQSLDNNEGQSDPGVQLALYFQQNAPNITNAYDILANKNLLTVVQTALGISPLTSEENIDTQANMITSKLNISDLQNPAKLQDFIERFSVLYDENNPSTTTSSNVPNAVLSDSSSSSGFSESLLSSMQGIYI